MIHIHKWIYSNWQEFTDPIPRPTSKKCLRCKKRMSSYTVEGVGLIKFRFWKNIEG